MTVDSVSRFLRMALQGARSLDDPRAAWLITELLSFGKIEADPRVGSLAIGYGPWGYDMRISPGFVEKYCGDSPQSALFLLFHEINHKVRGDLWADRRHLIGPSQREREIANMAADMIINRYLERSYFPEGVPLMAKVYRPDQWPEVLLTSPMVIKDHLCSKGRMEEDEDLDTEVLAAHFAHLGCERSRRAALCYLSTVVGESLWKAEWDDSVDLAELYLELRDILQEESLDAILFLGDHGEEREATEIALDPGLSGILVPGASSGPQAGKQERLCEKEIVLEEPTGKEQQAILLSAIRRAMVEDGGRPRLIPKATTAERGVVFSPGRRELFFITSDHLPLFYPQILTGPGWSEDRLWFYVDASGSMNEMLPVIYGLLNVLGDYVGHSPVLMFSNEVVPTSIAQIRQGQCPTSQGTDFDCVVEHARKEGARRILVLTDGYGDLMESNREFLKQARVEVYLVLTEDHGKHNDCPLLPQARNVWVWPTIQ